MRVLVIGGTRVLAPAARRLTAGGHQVTILARDTAQVIGDAIGSDAANPAVLSTSLGTRRWDAGLVYLPATTAAVMAVLRRAVIGPLVRVQPSSAGEPGRADPLEQPHTLLLGWAPDAAGSRWHTAEEISAAAVAVLHTGQSALLGVIRPWEGRP